MKATVITLSCPCRCSTWRPSLVSRVILPKPSHHHHHHLQLLLQLQRCQSIRRTPTLMTSLFLVLPTTLQSAAACKGSGTAPCDWATLNVDGFLLTHELDLNCNRRAWTSMPLESQQPNHSSRCRNILRITHHLGQPTSHVTHSPGAASAGAHCGTAALGGWSAAAAAGAGAAACIVNLE
jgi:hypothetical protein